VDLAVVVDSQRPLQRVLPPREYFDTAFLDTARDVVTLG
jgi:hypothetical protein